MARDLEGAILVPAGEQELLVSIALPLARWGWFVEHDVQLIPDHGKMILMTDHHRVLHASFRTEPEAEAFVDRMAAAGHALPEELQDETFKVPSWMKKDQ